MSYHNILSLFSSLQININILYTKTWYRLQVWVHESHTWKSIIYLHWRKGYTLFFPTKKVLPDIIRIILSKKKKTWKVYSWKYKQANLSNKWNAKFDTKYTTVDRLKNKD